VFPTYAAGAPLGLRPLGALEAIALLGAAGSALPEDEPGLRALVAWAEATPAYRLVHGDLGAAVERVRSLLADGPA
jgi:hypothetical protein